MKTAIGRAGLEDKLDQGRFTSRCPILPGNQAPSAIKPG